MADRRSQFDFELHALISGLYGDERLVRLPSGVRAVMFIQGGPHSLSERSGEDIPVITGNRPPAAHLVAGQ
jgi:hypothetical protein